MKNLLVLFLLVSFVSSATAVEIVPSIIEIDLIGGDSVIKEIRLTNTKSIPIECKLSTSILPNGEGINVSYSDSDFIIPAFSTYIVEVNINTSICLSPDSYQIKTIMEFTCHEKTRTTVRYLPNNTFYLEDITEPIIDEPDQAEPIPEDILPDDISIPVHQPIDYTIYYICLSAILLLFTLLCLFKKKKEKK